MFLTKLKPGTAAVLCACLIGGSFTSLGVAQDAKPKPARVYKIIDNGQTVLAIPDKAGGVIVFRETVYKIINGQTVAEDYKIEINIAACRIITPNGKQVPNKDLWKRLKNDAVVVLSTDGQTPDQPFLRALNAETLVIIPAALKIDLSPPAEGGEPNKATLPPQSGAKPDAGGGGTKKKTSHQEKEPVEQGIPDPLVLVEGTRKVPSHQDKKEPVEQGIPDPFVLVEGTSVLQSVKPKSYDGDPTDYLWHVLGLKVEKAAESEVTGVYKGLRGGVTVIDIRRQGPAAAVLQRGDILVRLDVWETLDAQACAYVLLNCQEQGSKSVKYHVVRNAKLLTGSTALHFPPSVDPKIELSPKIEPSKGTKVGRLLKERLVILKEFDYATEKAFQAGVATFAELVEAKALFLRAEMALCEGNQERLKVHEKIVAFAREFEQRALELHRNGLLARTAVMLATSKRLEAEIALERAMNGTSNRLIPPSGGVGTHPPVLIPAVEPKTTRSYPPTVIPAVEPKTTPSYPPMVIPAVEEKIPLTGKVEERIPLTGKVEEKIPLTDKVEEKIPLTGKKESRPDPLPGETEKKKAARWPIEFEKKKSVPSPIEFEKEKSVTFPDETPNGGDAAQDSGAEKLYRAMEKKVRAAKSLHVAADGEMDSQAIKGTVKATIYATQGNKSRMEIDFEIGGKANKVMLLTDGKARYTKQGDKGTLDANPKKAEETGKLVPVMIARIGISGGLLMARAVKQGEEEKEVDLDKDAPVTNFKLGAKEMVGISSAQVVTYQLDFNGKSAKMSVWIDTKTQLPLKRVVAVDEDGQMFRITETYSTFVIDPKLDPKLFEIPKQ